MTFATRHELMAALIRTVRQMSDVERAQLRKELDRRMTGDAMENGLSTLALNDFDRDFVRSLGIQIPEESRWELDGDAVSDPAGSSDCEAAE
jgi:hypothetical protein